MNKQNKNVRFVVGILLILAFLACLALPASAEESILDKVKNSKATGDVITSGDHTMAKVVDVARGVGVLITIAFVLWAGYAFLFSPSGHKFEEAKMKLVGVIFFAFCTYKTESIVAAILKLVGYEI